MLMSTQELIIEGTRQNNLRNITLSIPHNKVIAVTGVSGSGKSSLTHIIHKFLSETFIGVI